MDIRQVARVLRARRRLVLTAFFAVALAGTALAWLLPRQYTATVAMVIDAKSANALLGGMLPPQMLGGYMATQVDIITSRRVTERAAAQPEIARDPALLAKWREASEERVDFATWFGTELQQKLEVQPSRDSNMVLISYACPEPERCARVANAVAAAYTDTNLEMRVAPARQSAEWFDARTQNLRGELEAAQRKLSEYQREHGIVATDERLDVETARLDELSRQLVTVQTEASGSRSWRDNMGGGETLPEVVRSPVIASLKGELARLEAQLSQTAARLGRNHPERVRTEREIASLRQGIALETRRIAGSIGTTDEVNKARETALREAVDRQKAQVLRLKAQRDQIAVLQKDVERAQHVYDLVTGRLAETNLESQAQQTNVFMLAPATPPPLPSSPRRLLMVALSLVLGLLLGVSLALLLELMRRRVRSEADVLDALGIPVVGVLPRAMIAPPRKLIGPPH